jgi:hypothetical protein
VQSSQPDYEFHDDEEEEVDSKDQLKLGTMGDKLKKIMAEPQPGPSGLKRGSLPFPSTGRAAGKRASKRSLPAQLPESEEEENEDNNLEDVSSDEEQTLRDKMKGKSGSELTLFKKKIIILLLFFLPRVQKTLKFYEEPTAFYDFDVYDFLPFK